jgi:O-antigen ligase/polysaccharide polymerase Wzy-like membrane protein
MRLAGATAGSDFGALEQRATALRPVGPVRFLLVVIIVVWSASFVVGFQSSLAVLAVIGAGAAIIGIFRPQLGLLGAAMLCTLDAPARVFLLTGGVWRWNLFNYWLLCLLVLFVPLAMGWRDLHTRLLQLLTAVLVIGLVVSPDQMSGVQHIFGLLAPFGLMVYFSRAGTQRPLLYEVGAVCGTLSALGSLAFLVQERSLPNINANAFVFFPLTGMFAICLGFPQAVARSRAQIASYGLAAANLSAVFLTGSRGGMLIGVMCALYLTIGLRGTVSRLMSLGCAALLTLGVATQFSQLQVIALHRVDKLLDSHYSLTARTSGRYDLALGAVYLFRSEPLGVGTGGFAVRWRDLGNVPGLSRFKRGREVPAHSAWTKTLAENGIPGFALLAMYVMSFAFVGMHEPERSRRMLGVLVTVVLAVAFLSTEFQGKGLWLLAAGVTTLLQPRNTPAQERGYGRTGRVSAVS